MKCFIFIIAAVLCTVCSQAKAGILTKAELEAVVSADGYTQYRIAYLTESKTTADLSSYEAYRQFVASDLSGTTLEAQGYGIFNPIISLQSYDDTADDPTDEGKANARDLTNTNPADGGIPIYRADGVKIEENYANFWNGNIDNPINLHADGDYFQNVSGSSLVLTGTGNNGLASNPVQTLEYQQEIGPSSVRLGKVDVAALGGASPVVPNNQDGNQTAWVSYTTLPGSQTATAALHLYAISALNQITVSSSGSSSTPAVPEPSTAIAMGLLGVVGFAGNRRRRNRSQQDETSQVSES